MIWMIYKIYIWQEKTSPPTRKSVQSLCPTTTANAWSRSPTQFILLSSRTFPLRLYLISEECKDSKPKTLLSLFFYNKSHDFSSKKSVILDISYSADDLLIKLKLSLFRIRSLVLSNIIDTIYGLSVSSAVAKLGNDQASECRRSPTADSTHKRSRSSSWNLLHHLAQESAAHLHHVVQESAGSATEILTLPILF